MHASSEVDVSVDFVRKDEDLRVALQHGGEGSQFGARVDGAGGVRRRVEHQQYGALGDGLLKLRGRYLEPLLHRGVKLHRDAACQFHHLHVAHPRRGGDNHLVAGIHQRQHGVAEFLLGAVAHHYLLGGELQAVGAQQVVADGTAQRQVSLHRGVVRKIVVDGTLGRLLDVVGSVEVGFADSHVYDVHAGGTQFRALGGHGKRRRRRQGADTPRNCLSIHSVTFLLVNFEFFRGNRF